MNLPVQTPTIVKCDNMGAVFLSRNSETKRTKYLDAKYHFVREHVENGVIEVIFVKSEENKADPFTKNVSWKIYAKNMEYLAGKGRN